MMRAALRSPVPWALLVAALVAVGAAVVVTANTGDGFPHEQHAKLFPLCTGCHAGAESGDRAELYPMAESCVTCHDGTVQPRVTWSGPRQHLTNLAFEHTRHQTATIARDREPLECEQCHDLAGAPRMTIQRANPDVCFSCHAHTATNHYVDAKCESCHVQFVRSELPAARMISLPVPEDHHASTFLRELHGTQAQADVQRCAMCHTRERCVACHVNAADVAQITALPEALHGWTLPTYAAVYPAPPSHLTPAWLEQHGPSASREQCAACHTREDCTACHVEPTPDVVTTLPARADATAPGIGTERRMPVSHASRFFEREHAASAAADPQSCTACHQKQYCADCHDAPLQPSYHPRNFSAQHASAAYGRRLECASCHEVRTFCRACHIQLGMQTEGRLGPGFHDAEPLWLLRHARAARQGLESCTSCHNQRDCLQCHSTLGAFRVNPHGPDFDAGRAQKRNPTVCFACHTNDPLGRTR